MLSDIRFNLNYEQFVNFTLQQRQYIHTVNNVRERTAHCNA